MGKTPVMVVLPLSNLSIINLFAVGTYTPSGTLTTVLSFNFAQTPKLEAISIEATINPGRSKASGRAAAKSGWSMFSTGSSGNLK